MCGRVTGYQSRTPDAFHPYGHEERSLESYYVDGVSLTHGPTGARQHIWTFAAGNVETVHPAIQSGLVHVLTVLHHYPLSLPL